MAAFLILQGIPALTAPVDDLPYGAFPQFVAPLVFGTVWVAFLALLMGVPVAVAIALFISHYAPRRLASGLGYVIDLLAAVPSVVYGLWGIGVLAPALQPTFVWLTENLGFIPLFAGPASGTGRTILTVAVVLAVMILPIVTALSPRGVPADPAAARGGRAGARRHPLGDDQDGGLPVRPARRRVRPACWVWAGPSARRWRWPWCCRRRRSSPSRCCSRENPSTIAANIALSFPEAYGLGVNQLIATGLVLFVITLAVNMIARAIINRRKEFSGAN